MFMDMVKLAAQGPIMIVLQAPCCLHLIQAVLMHQFWQGHVLSTYLETQQC